MSRGGGTHKNSIVKIMIMALVATAFTEPLIWPDPIAPEISHNEAITKYIFILI